MKIYIPYLKKVFGLIVSIFLFATSPKAQHSEKTITIDSSQLCIYWDSSQVKLDKSVIDKDYWFKILAEDTTFISFFQARSNNKPCLIYIASIDRIIGSSFQYAVLAYSRPMTINPKELLAFGYANYIVTIAPSLNGGHFISAVKFIGIAI